MYTQSHWGLTMTVTQLVIETNLFFRLNVEQVLVLLRIHQSLHNQRLCAHTFAISVNSLIKL